MENIIELSVKEELAYHFKIKAENIGAKFLKVVQPCKGILYYIIEADKSIHNQISDLGFMTFIKNPVFQKYYHGTDEFNKIAEQYIYEREKEILPK